MTQAFSNELITQLQNNRWFSVLPQHLQSYILQHAQLKQYQKDEALFHFGDPFTGIFGLLSGSVQLSYNDQDGAHAVTAIVEPIMWMGEISLIDEQPRSHDAICMQKSIVLHLNHRMIDHILERYPKFWFHIAQLTSQKLRLLFSELISIQTQSLKRRIAHRLWMILNGYGNHICIHQAFVHISQEQLANMLFCARQSVNQELRHLEDEHIIKVHFKKIEILDVIRLEQLAKNILQV
jgi:CRP/FNR family transcriptional regulator, cyclic AMP receptor protein